MSFLVIILSLLVDRFLGSLQDMRRWDWVPAWADWLAARIGERDWWAGPWGLLTTLGSLLLAFGLVFQGLSATSGLLGFLFALLILVFCLGPRSLDDDVEGLLEARARGDNEAAGHFAQRIHGGREEEGDEGIGAAIDGVLVQAHERLFGVIFWFAILGPLGALLYRMAVVLGRIESEVVDGDAGGAAAVAPVARRLHAILAWPVARLTALSYGLSGSLIDAMGRLTPRLTNIGGDHERLLADVGRGALRLEEEAGEGSDDEWVREAHDLVRRTLVIWLVVLALLTLYGWFF